MDLVLVIGCFFVAIGTLALLWVDARSELKDLRARYQDVCEQRERLIEQLDTGIRRRPTRSERVTARGTTLRIVRDGESA